jgi:hypothetical protein
VSTTAAAVTTTATAVEPTTTATAVEAATAEAPTAAMESAADVTAMEAAGSPNATAVVAAGSTYECVGTTCVTGRTVVKGVSNTRVPDPAATVASTATVVSAATVIAAAAIVSAATPVTVVPGAGADKEATDKPAGAVVAIGCASVGIVRIVTPGAGRSRVSITVISVSVSVTNPDTHTNLGVSRSRHQRYGNHQRAEQHKISEQLHFGPPRQGIMHCVTNRFGDTSNTLGYLRVPTTSNNTS